MSEGVVHSYKDLIVWQKGIELCVVVYEITDTFPKEELYGITSQMRRAAVSIPSNIAEGRHRGTKNDFLHFLRIAHGSAAELDTQIIIAKRLFKTKALDYTTVDSLLIEIMKILPAMIHKMNPR